jgi:hypothetical protein
MKHVFRYKEIRGQYTPDFFVGEHSVLRNTTSGGLKISPHIGILLEMNLLPMHSDFFNLLITGFYSKPVKLKNIFFCYTLCH